MSTHYVRHSSHHQKKNNLALHKTTKSLSLCQRPRSSSGKGGLKVTCKQVEVDDDSMAVSFLNYCAFCEKQIIVPSNAVLYCSQKCKKKDDEKSLQDVYGQYSPPIAPFANRSVEDVTFPDIVPQRDPTRPSSKRSSYAQSDMDVSSDENTSSSDEKSHYAEADAAHYLRHFQSRSYVYDTTRFNRSRYNRASTSQISLSAMPSLSHTPTSSHGFSSPFTPSTTRPLPPRHKPSTSSHRSKSIDLVTPLSAPSSPKQYSHKTPPISETSTSAIEGEIVYAKNPITTISPANGSLSQLMASSLIVIS